MNTIQVECPECGGKGRFCEAYDIDLNKVIDVSVNAYRCLPATEEDARHRNQHYIQYSDTICEVCDGRGVIDYEPDYEPDYDE